MTVTAHNFASDVDVSSNAKLRAERHGRKLNVHNAFHYSAPGGTAAYCAERVCMSIRTRISGTTLHRSFSVRGAVVSALRALQTVVSCTLYTLHLYFELLGK